MDDEDADMDDRDTVRVFELHKKTLVAKNANKGHQTSVENTE